MSLEKFEVRCFQKHRVLTVELSPTVTTFVGPTDVGKSSIIRGLRFLMLNQTPGRKKDSFIHWGAKESKLRLWIDGRKIVRRKGEGRNSYYLGSKEFKAFSTKVPEEIAILLNVDEVNFHAQLDRHFWFSLSAGEVSRELNAIIDLSVIDDTMSDVASALRKARSEVEVSSSRLTKAIQQKKELSFAPRLSNELTRLEVLHAKAEGRRKDCLAMRILIDKATRLRRQLRIARRAKEKAQEVLSLANTVEQLSRQTTDLRSFLDSAKHKQEKLCLLKESTDLAAKELNDYNQGKCPICNRPLTRSSPSP